MKEISGTSSGDSPRSDLSKEYSSYQGLSRPVIKSPRDQKRIEILPDKQTKDLEKIIESPDKAKSEEVKRRNRPGPSPTSAIRQKKFNTFGNSSTQKEGILSYYRLAIASF